MNIRDILTYEQNHVLEAVEDLSSADWETPGICGEWSAKDIVSHLASYENVLLDVLKSLLGDENTPHLYAFTTDENFDENEVAKRRSKSWIVVLAELALAHDEVMNLIDQIPDSILYKKGMLAWYGEDYYLEDFIVYTHYAHKQKHTAQIEAYKSLKTRVREVA